MTAAGDEPDRRSESHEAIVTAAVLKAVRPVSSCKRRLPSRVPPAGQRTRLIDTHDNLIARTAEAEREGWLGAVDRLSGSLVASEGELAPLARKSSAVNRGATPAESLAFRERSSVMKPYFKADSSAAAVDPEFVEGTFQRNASPSPST